MYITVKNKMIIATLVAIAWVAFCVWFDSPWFDQLQDIYGRVGGFLIVSLIAFLPGFMSLFLITGLLSDKRPIPKGKWPLPPITVLVAAYNEENHINETIDSILAQDYPNEIELLVISDGSTDKTGDEVVTRIAKSINDPDLKFRLIELTKNFGKTMALNVGLKEASHEVIVTLDADSTLYKDALVNIVNNLVNGPTGTAAVAGTVLVRNSRTNWLTKMQEFDYFSGIAVMKRVQSLLQGTMVAPGAFSCYWKQALLNVGGWPKMLGEDIVLTWGFLTKEYRVGYAENAFMFTRVPEKYSQFFNQRVRWARGLIEAYKEHPKILTTKRLNLPFVWYNFISPILDFAFLTIFVPGIILALAFQFYAIAGLMTLYLLPLTLLLATIQFYKQRKIFHDYGLKIRQNWGGFFLHVFFYQLIVSPACFVGYIKELGNDSKSWGTK